MSSLPSRLWSELTTTDVAAADMAATIAVLPVAAVEQHGPHLPLGTDAFIMEGYLSRVLARLPTESRVVVLPVQAIGCSVEHGDFAGTLSLSARTALDAWTQLAEAVASAGCRKLVVVNSHGGNSNLIGLLAHDLRARLKLFVVQASWARFGYPDGLFPADEIAHGVHGGQIETALMLAFRPDLVRMEAATDFHSAGAAIADGNRWLSIARPTGFGWMAQDLNPAGVVGDAGSATQAQGELCAEHGADAFVALLEEVARFDPGGLRPPPSGTGG